MGVKNFYLERKFVCTLLWGIADVIREFDYSILNKFIWGHIWKASRVVTHAKENKKVNGCNSQNAWEGPWRRSSPITMYKNIRNKSEIIRTLETCSECHYDVLVHFSPHFLATGRSLYCISGINAIITVTMHNTVKILIHIFLDFGISYHFYEKLLHIIRTSYSVGSQICCV